MTNFPTRPVELNGFCVFILTHGRPGRVATYKTLRNSGYTGKIFVLVDDQDPTYDQYVERFGDEVLTFSKKEIVRTFDKCDNFTHDKTIVFARNACWQLARQQGYTHFLQLDDDYYGFRWVTVAGEKVAWSRTGRLDDIFAAMLEFYKASPFLSIAFAQNGDFIGGDPTDTFVKGLRYRKCMNSFFCAVDRPFTFVGTMNEDVNAYVGHGHIGGLFLTIFHLALEQAKTQQTSGGMTESYRQYGTYVKTFYTVMLAPSCVKVAEIGTQHLRFHHRIDWRSAVPKIVDEKYRKHA